MVGSAMKIALAVIVHIQMVLDSSVNSKVTQLLLYVTECDTYKYFFNSECDGANASDVDFCKDSGGICVYHPVSREKACYCDNGSLVANNETYPGMSGY